MKNDIIFFTSEFPPQPGGIGNHAYNLILQLAKNGFNITTLTDSRSKDGKAEREHDAAFNTPIIRVPVRRPRFTMYFRRLFLLFSLIRKKKNSRPLLVASGKFPLWGMALMSCIFRKHRYIAIIHGSEVNFPGGFNRMMTRWSLRRFHRVIGVSNYTLSLVNEDVPEDKGIFIPNGFDSDRLKKPKKMPVKGQPALITLGGVTYRKGQHNVIKAMPEILKYYPEAHYHIVGIPREKEAFQNLAETLKVDAHITFHGVVDDERLSELMGNAHIFCMLSEVQESGDTEGFGIAIIEGNSLGLPAIGSRGCGIEDAIAHDRSGLHVDNHNPGETAQAVKNIYADYERFSRNATDWACQHTWEKIIQHYIAVFNEEQQHD
jgi:phosphatidylinositol alpha-1,6-mannosyltransferase